MVHPSSACSCSCGWYQPDVDLAPADAWWKEAIRHETENRWYVRQLPGAWAATFGGSQVDALIKHQVEVPSDRSFRPYGRRVLAEPRESEEFKKAMIWVDEEVPKQGRQGLKDLGVPQVAEGPGQLVPPQTDERQLPQSPPLREPAPEAQATEPVAVTLATQPMEPCLASMGDATLRTEALRAVPSEVTCSKCGAMVPADANFCPNCGASMTKQPVQVAVKAKSTPSKPRKLSKPSAKARSKSPARPAQKPRLGHWSLLRQQDLKAPPGPPEPRETPSFKPPRRVTVAKPKPRLAPKQCISKGHTYLVSCPRTWWPGLPVERVE